MCKSCDYEKLLISSGLEPKENRIRVLEAVGNNNYPLSATDVFRILNRNQQIHRVTVYRILDLLVSRGLLDRLSTGGRSSYYGLAPNSHHLPHPHFYCKICGQMDCLDPESLEMDYNEFEKTFPGRIDKVEVRIDGICKNCLNLSA